MSRHWPRLQAIILASSYTILPGCFLIAQERSTPADLVIADTPTDVPSPEVVAVIAELAIGTHLQHIAACDGSFLLHDSDGRLSRVDRSGQTLWQIQEARPGSESWRFLSNVMSTSFDSRLVANVYSGEVVVRSTLDGSPVARRQVDAFGLAFAPCSSDMLWLSTVDGHVERWAISKADIVRVDRLGSMRREHPASILVNLASREVLAVGGDQAIVWDYETRERKREFAGDWMNWMTTLSADGRHAVSLDRAKSTGWMNLAISARMTVWDIETGGVVRVVDGWRMSKDNAVQIDSAWVIADSHLAVCSILDEVRVIDLRNGAVCAQLQSASGVLLPLPTGTFVTTVHDSSNNRRTVIEYRAR